MAPEIWRPVPDYEGLYEVSDRGRVRSLDRWPNYSDDRERLHRGQILKQHRHPAGGYQVTLSRDGKVQRCWVRRLVASAFLANDRGKRCVIAGNPDDNRLESLGWGTPRPAAKLNEVAASSIRELHRAGIKQAELAKRFGVDPSCVSNICRGIAWRD